MAYQKIIDNKQFSANLSPTDSVLAHAMTKYINKQITPIVKGIEEESDGDASVNLPEEIAWAESNDMVKMVVSFLSTEAELMATMFVPHPLRAFMRSWVSKWDGEKAPEISREKWLRPVVRNLSSVHCLVARYLLLQEQVMFKRPLRAVFSVLHYCVLNNVHVSRQGYLCVLYVRCHWVCVRSGLRIISDGMF